MERKTPLYQSHVALGAKMVPFADYLLPVSYSEIIEEHMAVREAAGLFDVSHMGELVLSGSDALLTLQNICSNDLSKMANGKVRYSLLLNPDGGVIDDLLVYRLSESCYWLVVNAANREKDYRWIKGQLLGDSRLEDRSDEIAQIALQGPKSKEILAKLSEEEKLPQLYYTFVPEVQVSNIPCLISRTGYTGSFGYELYCKAEDAPALWAALLEAGREDGLIPCGLGARDTLRLEAGMPLYGHEMDEETSPLEAGLSFAVNRKKEDFIGKAGLAKRGEPSVTRVGLKVVGRGIIREGCPVYVGERQVGKTTSGTHLPYLKGAYAMALLEKQYSELGTPVTVIVRGRSLEAEVTSLPFYSEA